MLTFEFNPMTSSLDLVGTAGGVITTPPSVSLSTAVVLDYELGDVVTIPLNTSFTKGTNNIASMQYKKGATVMTTHSVGPGNGSDSYSDVGVTSATPISLTYTARVIDNASLSGTSNSIIVNFGGLFRRGMDATTPATEAVIEGLENNTFKNSFTGVYAFGSELGSYKYFSRPSSLGTVTDSTTSFVDNATGFPIPFLLQGTVSTTNSFGATVVYNVYRSVNKLGGAMTIKVNP